MPAKTSKISKTSGVKVEIFPKGFQITAMTDQQQQQPSAEGLGKSVFKSAPG